MSSLSYFGSITSELRLIVTRYLLEYRKENGEYCTSAIEMLFHPESPFSMELRVLFPELSIGSFGVQCNRMQAALYEFSGPWGVSDVLERFGRCMVELYTFSPEQSGGEQRLFPCSNRTAVISKDWS